MLDRCSISNHEMVNYAKPASTTKRNTGGAAAGLDKRYSSVVKSAINSAGKFVSLIPVSSERKKRESPHLHNVVGMHYDCNKTGTATVSGPIQPSCVGISVWATRPT